MSAPDDDLEVAFLSNGFYSSSQTISLSSSVNHLEILRSTVNFPNSASSTSINAGLLKPNEVSLPDASTKSNEIRSKPDTTVKNKSQRTSFMKASPSIKALENILNEKSSSSIKPSSKFADLIEEEAELEEEQPPLFPPVNFKTTPHFEAPQNISSLSVNNIEQDPNRASSYSVQTFQTAKSHESLPETGNSRFKESESRPIKRSSINTIEETGYSEMDETPVLSQPAVFHTMKSTNKDFSPKIVHEPINPVLEEADDDAQSTKVSNQTTNQSSEHDDTLIDTNDFKKSSPNQVKSLVSPVLSNKQGSLIPANFVNKNLSKKSVESSIKNYPSPQFSQESQTFETNEDSTSQSKSPKPQFKSLVDVVPSTLASTAKLSKSKSNPIISNTGAQEKTSKELPSPSKRASHSRSNSAFSISLSSPKKTETRHKRSSTLSTLELPLRGRDKDSKNKETQSSSKKSESKSSKKFSFKSLFKVKPKSSDSTTASDNGSQPKKIKTKSVSSPNLSQTMNASSNDKKKGFGKTNKVEETPKSNNSGRPGINRASSSSSILNVFKKNKSADNLTNLQNLEQIPATNGQNPPKSSIATLENDLFYESGPLEPSRAFKSNTNINFINEFDNEDSADVLGYNPNHVYTKPTIQAVDEGSDDHSIFADEDEDSINLFNNPPTKLSNPRFDQELTLIPPPSTLVLQKGPLNKGPLNAESETKDIFGSPFQVNYNSSAYSTPKITAQAPDSSKKLGDVSKNDNRNSKDSSRFSDQLLGEALFPKSLNPQEVESIVSLERSRSMRSIKSVNGGNKRNSFINYNGSDENIIQGNLMPISNPNTSIARSNSILKNSSSRKNLNVDSNEFSMNSIDANILSDSLIQPSSPVENIASGNNDVFETTDDNFNDLIEFTHFIDADDLDFSLSPQQLESSPEPRPTLLEPPPALNFDNTQATDSTLESVLITPPSSQNDKYKGEDLEEEEDAKVAGKDASEQSSVKNFDDSTLLADNEASEIVDRSYNAKSLTSNLPAVPPSANDKALPKSPESIGHVETSRIFETAFRTSQASDSLPVADDQGRLVFNNRPISMSFKGLSGPSFGGKLAKHDMRSSDSHQSFNISFGEDSSDIASTNTGVGAGFGSEDEENEEEDDDDSDLDINGFDFDNKENYHNETSSGDSKLSKLKLSNSFNNLSNNTPTSTTSNTKKRHSLMAQAMIPPPSLNGVAKPHNRIPLLSDSNNSSPRSFSSIISKIKKSAASPQTSPHIPLNPIKYSLPTKDGVRFSSRIILYDTYNGDEYDRHPDTATCNQLTPLLAQQIKEELNAVKSEMEVHEDSRCYTHFF